MRLFGQDLAVQTQQLHPYTLEDDIPGMSISPIITFKAGACDLDVSLPSVQARTQLRRNPTASTLHFSEEFKIKRQA